MELTEMKLPPPKKKGESTVAYDGPFGSEMWPYGLRLSFEKEQIDKLPSLKNYKVGDVVSIQAKATVTQVSSTERQKGSDRYTVEMQIEKIGCEPDKPLSKMSMKEYRAARENK